MPTPLADPISRGEDITFEQFIWRCVRGMMIAVSEREKPLDEPLPRKLHVQDVERYEAQVAELETELSNLSQMSIEDAERWSAEEHARVVADYERKVAEDEARRKRYESMIARVEAWQASELHEGLKSFALMNLRESLAWDVLQRPAPRPAPLPGQLWREQKLERVAHDLKYYQGLLKATLEKQAHASKWLDELDKTVPYPWGTDAAKPKFPHEMKFGGLIVVVSPPEDGTGFVPSTEDLEQLAQMFRKADEDLAEGHSTAIITAGAFKYEVFSERGEDGVARWCGRRLKIEVLSDDAMS